VDDPVIEAAADEAPNPPKQAYEAPQLVRHGTVAELTAGGAHAGAPLDPGSILP
jgi:hypothetical protein